MKRNILTFGLILGTILCINMVIMVRLFYTHPEMERNDYIGYTALIVMMSLIFFGVRNYRNKVLDGIISFGKAVKTGSLISLVAATMYVVVWLFYYYLFVPDFLDQYIPFVLSKTAPEDLTARTKEMENFREMYKNPFFVIVMTYMEVLPLGLIVTLISALILKKKVGN